MRQCTDLEGRQGIWTPLKNHKAVLFLSNTGTDPLKITKLPSKHSMLGHHRPPSETIAHFKRYLDSLSTHQQTSSPMGYDRSTCSQHNAWRHQNLRCSKVGNSKHETMTRKLIQKHKNYVSSTCSYLQVLKTLNKICRENLVNVLFSDAQRAAHSVVSYGIWPKFKLVHTFMYVLVTYKDEENQMKNEGARVVTTLYSYILDAQ